jgi:amino acid transporter
MSMVLLGINSIVGSGIFLLPGQAMALVGTWSIFVYLFVSLLVLAIAWCFAKCASIFNRNGGSYVYAKEAFGNFIGFEIGLMRWAVGMIAWASLAVGFVTVLSSIWPLALQEPIRSSLILSLIWGLGLINILGVRLIKQLSNIITVAKLIPLVFFVFIGIFFVNHSNFVFDFPVNFEKGTFGSAVLVIFYAFGGFETLAVVAQEMKNPTKNVPLAVMIVVSVCAILYFFIQLIAIGILGPALATSMTPIADVAELIYGPTAKGIIMIATLVSIGGVNIASSFITPRSAVALAEDEMIPKIIAQKGRFGTPYFAILITLILTSLVAISGDFTQLVTISVVSRFAQYTSTCLAVYVFHKDLLSFKKPLLYSIKAFIPLIALSGICWLFLQATLYQLYWGLGGLIAGIPLYFIQQKYARKMVVEQELNARS